ncbi:MAG: tRNA (N(6)-L-threonylcarbamoyladenosine(37)-C(2))-methylthiotransferase MtaB [Dysgonamonadaceae bacterium]|jgi:threonylcarbamoyladenosine tRNA methylthiotransferase MtaB|nr:tRNA (N(6)-L-threonylcarbamoyladenosine(37)-C(2))-methylthiotransferase MtaB [Dysgonamonadaceae bacterium]
MIDTTLFQNQKAAYYTLGCKLNFAETSSIGKQLADNGIRKVLPGETADWCIINTCSVTELADKKCRQAIRRIKQQHPEAFVIVTGCYAQLKPEEVRRIEGVNLVLGAGQKTDIAAHLQAIVGQKNRLELGEINLAEVLPVKEMIAFEPSCAKGDRTRYFLKVQDGCDYYCSYCTIPFARGRSRNGSIASLAAQAEEAGCDGAKEIVLTGVNIGDFGKTTGETFFDLLKALEKVASIDRFRISSIEPNLLTDEMIEWVAHSSRIAPHFHIPLQAGSDAVLQLMRRKYTTAFFTAKIQTIKRWMPHAFIGVDVIVGTRGETDAYFEETKQLLESLPVSQLHVFSYSERPGTKALEINPVVSSKEKQERSKQLLALSERKTQNFYRSQIGTTHSVLFEHTKHSEKMHGFTENYIKVETDYCADWVNRLQTITLSGFNSGQTALTIQR